MQNAFGVVSHAGGVVTPTTPPQHPCFFIAVVPVLTPFANGYLPYHIDQIHLASNYLLASFTLSIAKKSEGGWQLRSDPIYKPTGSSIPFDP